MNYLLWHNFVAAAARYPKNAGVVDHQGTTTYEELDRWSACVTGVLQQQKVGRGSRIGLLAPKSARNVAVMLGSTKAGSAYVPVDPSAPAARSAFILGDAGVRIVFTTRKLMSALAAHSELLASVELVVLIDGPADSAGDWNVATLDWNRLLDQAPGTPAGEAIESDPAYILYTSGSTGKPKGVVISHRNALAFIDWSRTTYDVGPTDRLSSHAPFHFDLSVFDLYAALHSGAAVHLIPDMTAAFPYELARWIEESGITTWYSVPSALIRLLRQGELERFEYRSLRTVLFAGEVFPVRFLRDVMERFPAASFHNLYGPTETNVCTHHPVPRPLEGDRDLPIGRACANFDTFAVTGAGTVAVHGEEGELLVRGPGVMLGYWGLPGRTAESLVQNPLHSEFVDLVYRTGDMVRADDADGFVFLGRRDHMVKTRGYRVELGEVEHALHQHPAVADAAVVAVPDDEIGARLAAYVVAADGAKPTLASLAAFCGTLVPPYAIPEEFTMVAELPRTSTGKVDRGSLLDARALTTQEASTPQ